MNYRNSVQKNYYKQPVSRHVTKVDMIKFAMILIPIILLIIVLTFTLNSFGVNGESVEIKVQEANTGNGEDGARILSSSLPAEKESSEDETEDTVETIPLYTDQEVEIIAKTVYGEALVTRSDMEMAAVVWCILNRVDSSSYPNTIEEVVTQKRQFHGYNEQNPVTGRVERVVRDVLDRWYAEKNGDTDSGRILPKDYLYFEGDGKHNHYSKEFLEKEHWDWSLPNPYEN